MNKFYLFIIFSVLLLSAQESRIEKISINSPSLSISRYLNILLPPGYDNEIDIYYPTLYLFRGHEDEWVDKNEDASRNGRNIKILFDQLFNNGQIGEMIVVMPGLFYGNSHSLGRNYYSPELVTDTLGFGTGQFEDYIIKDLIPFIDKNYRTVPSRSKRAIDGFSAGGYTAMFLGSKHPDLFSSIGSYDGYFWTWLDFNDPYQPGELDDPELINPSLNAVFGVPPRDIEYMKSYNPANLISDAQDSRFELLKITQFLIHYVGEAANIGLLTIQKHVLDIMDQKGLNNYFEDPLFSLNAQHNWWYADEHMLVTFPLHWEQFQKPDSLTNAFPLILNAPARSEVIDGVRNISWQIENAGNIHQSILEYSDDDGVTWIAIVTLDSEDNSYNWNTELVPDGTRYCLRVNVLADSGYAVDYGNGRFTINNPVSAHPEVFIQSPLENQSINGNWEINWFAEDADADLLSLSLWYSPDAGNTWHNLFENQTGILSYIWDTYLLENSPFYQLKIIASDNLFIISDTTFKFKIYNERLLIPKTNVKHVNGTSAAEVIPQVVDVDVLSGDCYRLTVHDSTGNKLYSVLNLNTGQPVVQNAWQLDGLSEGPYFDGMRLLIKDFNQTVVDLAKSGWQKSSSTLGFTIFLPTIDLGNGPVDGFPYPADYYIRLSESISDTSNAEFGVPAVHTYFNIRNITENRAADFLFVENNVDQKWNRNDDIYIIEKNENAEWMICWQVRLTGTESDIDPQPGDEFLVKTLTPLTPNDVYEFDGKLTGIETRKQNNVSSFLLYQNFPNPFNNKTKILFYIPTSKRVELIIYDILGQKIITLRNGVLTAGWNQIIWDGKNQNGMTVNSGIYFMVLNYGQKRISRKLLLVK